MNLNENEIRKLVGDLAYIRGKSYDIDSIEYVDVTNIGTMKYYEFKVKSQSYYDSYEVYVIERNGKITGGTCDCMAYDASGTCKHIAACMQNFNDLVFYNTPEEKGLKVSRNILKEFYDENKSKEIKLKKQLNLEITLEFSNSYYSAVTPKMKIGEDKLYNLNNKLNAFLDIYKEENDELYFGKNFTYNPAIHFFSKTDENFINYLMTVKQNNPYYNMNNFTLTLDQSISLINNLKGKDFYIGNTLIRNIKEENPIKMKLNKDGELYKLEIIDNGALVLDKEYKYVVLDDTLYIMPKKQSNILNLMAKSKINELTFKEEDLESFTQGLLPIVKNNVEVSPSLENKITIGKKPDVQLYIDLKNDLILCTIKLIYNNVTIDYFEKTPNILRDTETEEEVVSTLLQYGFTINNNQIYIEDMDIIGEFLETNITELATIYEVFTSNKIKETRILKDNSVRSTFSIGTDNILKYEFDLGDIRNDEISNILDSLNSKKKYYKLKNGNIINLNESEDLKELDDLITDMELSKKDIKEGTGIIPKYRAIYLDSIKKEKYHIIKTNNLFDELINNFTSYKDAKVGLTKKDKEILRDYQVTGVKWLYNIYKCGFGGILADEMGLGKSIQLIYFIKEILKENKNARILIVAPTSLIYNWQNEFDKFGPELNYKVFAENKNLRKLELENNESNILITTYGLVRQDKKIYEKMNFELIAIDEAQNIKNPNAEMTKVVKSLKANTKIALTGTPLENSVIELWSIFDFIMPGYLANKESFGRKYNIHEVDEKSLSSLSNLNSQIKPFILRRKKKDVVKDLPDKIENNIYVNLDPEQKKLYIAESNKTRKELDEIIENEGFKKGSFKILQLLTKLRQLCISPNIIYENYKGKSAKIEELINITKQMIENGHKILLFTSFKTALDLVNKEFTNHNISTYVIDGSVSSKKRMELVNNFNKNDTNVFLITLKSGGTGLNLTSADIVIHLDLWWNPQVENQATDRAHRIGQTKSVEVVKLICKGTIEERILELQNKKKILSDALIEGEGRDQNIISKLSEEDIKNLFSLDNEDEE